MPSAAPGSLNRVAQFVQMQQRLRRQGQGRLARSLGARPSYYVPPSAAFSQGSTAENAMLLWTACKDRPAKKTKNITMEIAGPVCPFSHAAAALVNQVMGRMNADVLPSTDDMSVSVIAKRTRRTNGQ